MRRGFTLIEISIVAAIMMILIVPLGDYYVSTYQKFHSLVTQVDARADAEAVAARVDRILTVQHGRIDADNHGVTVSDRLGSNRIHWNGREILSAHGPMMREEVSDFSVIRRGGIVTVTVAVEPPDRRRRDAVLRLAFDFEAGARR
jgi:prepilin-type N-terminal cleavage/methylation domain-containing protein